MNLTDFTCLLCISTIVKKNLNKKTPAFTLVFVILSFILYSHKTNRCYLVITWNNQSPIALKNQTREKSVCVVSHHDMIWLFLLCHMAWTDIKAFADHICSFCLVLSMDQWFLSLYLPWNGRNFRNKEEFFKVTTSSRFSYTGSFVDEQHRFIRW